MAVLSLREIAVANAATTAVIDQITDTAPIIGTCPFMEANNSTAHIYENIVEIGAGQHIAIDGQLTTVEVKSDIEKQDIGIIGGKMIAKQDTLNFSNKSAQQYFRDTFPKVAAQTLMNLEEELIYNTLLPFAVKSGQAIDAEGDDGANYSIIAVRWEQDNMCGLYNPKMYDPAAFFRIGLLDGGNATEVMPNVVGYRAYFKAYLAFLLANKRNISAIVNIDASTDNAVTADMMDDLLANVEADRNVGETYIYMHPRAKNKFLNKFKENALQTVPREKEYNRTVATYDGVPIVLSRNFLKGTESNIVVP